jgi:hypothetical protein
MSVENLSRNIERDASIGDFNKALASVQELKNLIDNAGIIILGEAAEIEGRIRNAHCSLIDKDETAVKELREALEALMPSLQHPGEEINEELYMRWFEPYTGKQAISGFFGEAFSGDLTSSDCSLCSFGSRTSYNRFSATFL